MENVIIKTKLNKNEQRMYDFITNDETLSRMFFEDCERKIHTRLVSIYENYRQFLIMKGIADDLGAELTNFEVL